MQVKFLGTGGSIGIPEIGCKCEVCTSNDKKNRRLRASVLIYTKGKQLLIDCGPDFRQQMLQEPFLPIDGVLVTHEHFDHVGGIDDLRTFNKFGDVDIYSNSITVKALKNRMPYCFANVKYPGVPNILLNEVANDKPFFISDIEIQPVTVMHYLLPIYGYRIGNFAYLTDVKTIPEAEFAKLNNLDVLVISALRHEEHIAHQNIETALEVVARIAPKRAYLMHMSHSLGLHEVEDAKLPENVHLAYDGLVLDI